MASVGGEQLDPVAIWAHYLSQCKTRSEVERLGLRLKKDLELNDTFRDDVEELREMYREYLEGI